MSSGEPEMVFGRHSTSDPIPTPVLHARTMYLCVTDHQGTILLHEVATMKAGARITRFS